MDSVSHQFCVKCMISIWTVSGKVLSRIFNIDYFDQLNHQTQYNQIKIDIHVLNGIIIFYPSNLYSLYEF